MNDNLLKMKAGLAALCTGVGTLLGWKGIMMLAWVGVMALDYLSGTLAACREGQWSSAVARQGLWHKGGMILVVVVSAIADGVMAVVLAHIPAQMQWPGLVMPLVLTWYILTELGSVLENAVRMGANVPEWLVKLLKTGAEIAEKAGDQTAAEKE